MTGQGYGQPSSRALAVMVAVANLVVCGGVVVVLSVARDGGAPAAFTTGTTTTTMTTATTSTAAATTTTTSDGPAARDVPTSTGTLPGPDGDYTEVTGPGGMTTHIPAGWPTRTATGPGAMQADDPAGTSAMLRYGGSATTVTDSYDVHADYERRFAAGKQAYTSIRLDRTVVRGMPAIDWEFEYDAEDGRRHVRSVYWLHGGYEYFVYASAPVPHWDRASRVLEVMLTYSTP
ncbi:hypothetical protein [Actinophytocola glycyrrhizae]|uniref:Serine/threonine protein kinase n=1 Tax=Actinophytocola glycyrrhizae TaxID=2044873 RepID=A0ABV9SA19_9PSEU